MPNQNTLRKIVYPGGAGGFLPSDFPYIKTWQEPDGLLYNGSNFIHQWTDISGNGNHLLQATETNKPLRVAGLLNGYDGVRFNGVDNFLKTLDFTWNQPETIYIVFNQVSWINTDRIFDGKILNSGNFTQKTSSPNLLIHAGVTFGEISDFTIGSFHIGTIIFNGANSLIQHNNGTTLLGDAGTNDMGGFTLAAAGDSSLFGNIEVMEKIGYDTITHTAEQRTQVKNYLSTKYNIAL